MNTYRDTITRECHKLSKNKNTIFIGYNTACGSQMYGTLARISKKQIIETPVAENLMMGLAMGMSLEGYRPVVCFERSNFLYAAADAIRHHLCMLPKLSGGQFNFPVVLRVIAGHDKPLDPGLQHKAGYATDFAALCSLDWYECSTIKDIKVAYEDAKTTTEPLMIIEYKEFYEHIL